MRWGLVLVSGGVLSLAQGVPIAAANGRFPKAQVLVAPADEGGRTLYLRATFGILVSRDGGRSFRWICEQALGFEGVYDPPIATARDGRLYAGLTDGLRVSRDGCDLKEVPSLRGEQIIDLTTDGTGRTAYVVTSTPGRPAAVYREEASGAFTRLGKGWPGYVLDTIEVAASKPSRVYVTGYPTEAGASGEAHLFRSDDGGATFVEMRPTLDKPGRLFVSAVSPKDPNHILVRQLRYDGSTVLRSTDGGRTLAPVLTLKGALLGFAQSEDGVRVWAGSGDANEGLFRSTDGGRTWEVVNKVSVFCLAAVGPKLFVCSMPFGPDSFLLAESADEGRSLTKLSTFDAVKGAVECDAGSAAVCAPRWPEVQAVLAATASAMAEPPPPESSAATAASSSSSSAAAASAPLGAAGERSAPKSRCGCIVAGASEPWVGAFPMLASSCVMLARRRRRRVVDPLMTTGEPLRPQRA